MRELPGGARQALSLVDTFREQSEHHPEKVLFTYLRGGERRGLELTAAELERRARRLAGWLQELAQPGDRALLRYPTGPDFVIALVACLYAEVIAVPVPGDGDTARHILADSGAALVLTAEPRAAAGRAALPAPPIPTFDTRDGPPAAAGEWRPRHPPADRVAYLQYTSGSVSAPRGVMVTHANVLHNLRAIDADFRHDDASVIQSWLPHYHDMGLIYGILQTVVAGTRCVVMSPGAFVQRPLRWLRAISDHGCTHSGGPNFAYEMCARRVTAGDLASLDLRRWRVAFNGAEPVRSATLRRFVATFGACGFDAGAIHPAYGLAEATLKVAGRPHAGAWRETAFDTAALAGRRAIAASAASSAGAGGADPTLLVSCGRPVGDTAVQVVDPVRRRAVGQGEMGEVWVSGPSVAAGYWNRPEASREVFAARCQDREGDHLRTGDLGFLHDGELYLAGRLKDIVIVRGRNLFPQDLEALSSQAHPILNRAAVAAFGVGGDEGSEEVVIVQEVVRRAIDQPPAVLAAAIAAIRRAVIERFQVRPRIVLAGQGSVPKTSSGKPRRQACRERWLAGRLAALLMDSASLPVAAAETGGSTVASLLHGGEWGDWEVALLAWLRQEVGRLSEPPAPEAPLDAALPLLGIDSVRCLQLSSRIQATAAAEIGVGELLAAADLGAIWQCILERQSPAASASIGRAAGAPAAANPAPLSHAQQAQWLLAELAGAGPTRNISAVIGLAGELEPAVLARCLAEIVRRHEILRTRYDDPPPAGPPGAAAAPPGPLQQVDPPPASVPMAAAAVAGEAELRELALREAARAFDLRRGPVLHLCLARLGSGGHALLVTLHHIAADGPSVSLLMRELAELYAAHLQGREPRLPALAVQYGDYARWQRQDPAAAGPPGASRAYWRERLAGLDQAPAGTRGGLPAARPGAGAEHRFELGPEPWRRLRQLGRDLGATPFMVLLAGFAALRQRYSGAGEVVVGAPIDQRRRPELAGLIGLFMNLLPYRIDLGREPSVRELLRRVRETALTAYAHQEVPFAEAGRALGGEAPPVAWTLTVHPDPPALESAGVRFSVDEIHVALAEFELELHLWASGESLQGLIFYRAGAWEERAAARLAAHYCNLLRALAADAGQPVWRLGMLSEAERTQLLAGAAVAGAAPARTLCELFEAQAARRPQATALSRDELHLSYGELNRRANRLGRRLRRLGIDVDGRVGVCLERSAELVVTILGILKAGAAYVPLEPANPVERLAAMIAGAGVTVVVTTAALRQRLQAAAGGARLLALDEQRQSLAPPGADPAPLNGAYPAPLDGANPAPRALPGSLAYVIHTSGSTGRPKGVMVTHANVARLFTATEPWYGFGSDDVWLLFHSYAFDFSVWEMWGALLYGGRLAVMPGWGAGLPATLGEVARREAVTVLNQTPAALGQWLRAEEEAGWPGGLAVRRLFAGGEALSPAILRSWFASRGDRGPELVNLYGVTETAVIVSGHAVRAGEPGEASPIGRALPDLRARVVDGWGEPVPVGVAGELWVGGPAVARGYAGQPDKTAARFVPDGWSTEPGERLYRTGDEVLWGEDGELRYLGRIDRQVKLRGYRIEPGEIEAALRRQPGVRDAAVVVGETPAGERCLVGYVAADPDPDPAAAAARWRAALRRRLPDYMVPAAIVSLERLPLNQSGKLDRAALPAMSWAAADGGDTNWEAPRTPVEQVLAGIWSEVLGCGPVSRGASFFELGGHSLTMTQAASRVRRAFGVELPARQLYDAPVLHELARQIEQRRGSDVDADPPLAAGGSAGPWPLSYGQRQLWAFDQLAPGDPAYNVSVLLRLGGELRVEALAASLADLVERHEILRTRYTDEGGEPAQWVAPPPPLALAAEDAAGEAELDRLALAEARLGFDLRRGPVIRFRLLRLGPEDHALLATVHHIAADGWSIGILARELGALYGARCERREPRLPPLALQYRDYAGWQRQRLGGGRLLRGIGYWRGHLAASARLRIGSRQDRAPHAAAGGEGRGDEGREHRGELGAALSGQLRELGRRQGVTAFMALLAGFAVLLQRHSGRNDFVVGAPATCRDRLELEGLVGLFVNLLPLRFKLNRDASVGELLDQVREVVLSAYLHQDIPYDQIAEAVRRAEPETALGDDLVQAVLSPQDEPAAGRFGGGLRLARFTTQAATLRFPLELHVAHADADCRFALLYRAGAWDEPAAVRLAAHYRNLLHALAADAGQPVWRLGMLSAAERAQLLAGAAVAGAAPARTLCELFEAQAARRPQATALSCDELYLSYGELNRRANRLGRRLRQVGIDVDGRVGVCLERSAELVVTILGVLKAGAAYVPLEPANPVERLAAMIAGAGVTVVVTTAALRQRLQAAAGGARLLALDEEREPLDASPAPLDGAYPEPLDGANPPPLALPGSLAYVIHTSGSTGRPKGVMVTHANVARLFTATEPWYGFGSDDVWLLFHSYAFDFSVWEMWGALLYGGRLAVMPGWGAGLPATLGEVARREAVTVLNQTPAALGQWLRAEEEAGWPGGLAVRRLFAGGEALPPASLRSWFTSRGDSGPALVNLYGVTETAVIVSGHAVRAGEPGEASPIGRVLPDLRARVVDGWGEPVPVGVAGELWVGGPAVARGYAGQPDKTAACFVPDGWSGEPGERLYRTGDEVLWGEDGELRYLGRIDRQVKLRGYRIEPGEIEAALRRQPGVRDAAVVVGETPAGEPCLVGYVAAPPDPDPAAAAARWRAALRRHLPDYMVPAAIVSLERLPLNQSGKLDRAALPMPPPSLALPDGGDGAWEAPRTPVEQVLAGIWAEVLGCGPVSRGANFFELGGHSLTVTQAAARVRPAFGVELPARQLYDTPVLHELARQIERRRGSDLDAGPPLAAGRGAGPWPLSYAQQRLWTVDQLAPGDPAYNIAAVVRLRGELRRDALERGLGEIVARHESLRTRFADRDGEPIQVIDPAAPLRLPLAEVAGEAELQRLARREARHRFDLRQSWPLRAVLARLGPSEHALLLTLHHIAADGWSVGVLVRELGELYAAGREGRPPRLAPLALQYKDYARWQRERWHGERLQRSLEHWRRQLAGAPPSPLGEGLDRTAGNRDAADTGGHDQQGAEHRFEVGPELTRRLQELARREGVTLFMAMLAAFVIVLRRHGAGEDLVVGTDAANRDRVELEELIGFFVNQLVLRLDAGGDPSARELLRRVRETALTAYAHQETPFEQIVGMLQPVREAGRHPLFQVKLALQNAPLPALQLAGLEVSAAGAAAERVKLDLLVDLAPRAGGLAGRIEFATARFDLPFVEGLAVDLVAAAELLAEAPAASLAELVRRLDGHAERRRAALAEALRAANRRKLAHRLARRPDAAQEVR